MVGAPGVPLVPMESSARDPERIMYVCWNSPVYMMELALRISRMTP